MRNDARPIGEDSHQSPVAADDSTVADRRSTEQRAPVAREEQPDDEDREPALPADDATLKTKI